MKLEGAVTVVTGGAHGIGEAIVDALVRERAAAVVVFDRDASGAAAVATRHASSPTSVIAESGDARSRATLEGLVQRTEERFGRIDLFCSNAGVMIDGGFELTDEQWQLSWDINVMAHVHAARAAMPGMLERGGGHFLNVLSAASLLTAPGAAAYASTKHAAIGFAEWLAIAHRSRGIRVSVVCPGAVRTQMLVDSLANGNAGVRRIAESGTILDPAVVAEAAITGVKEDRFLITSHEDTLANTQRKWSGPDRWVQAMAAFLEKASQ